ncbi:helix-turn-helix domain-containing protein [Actinomadura miaoliensis]
MNSEEIVTAAIRHLNEHPTASMAQLAEAIGVSRATLHRHFASRETLLHALGRRAVDRWERDLEEADADGAAASGDPARVERALRLLLRGYVQEADEHGFALTDHFIGQLPDLAERGARLEEREQALYAAAQAAGLLRADLPVRWIGNAVYGLLVAVRESLRRGDVARRDVEDLLLTTFLRGAGAEAADGAAAHERGRP